MVTFIHFINQLLRWSIGNRGSCPPRLLHTPMELLDLPGTQHTSIIAREYCSTATRRIWGEVLKISRWTCDRRTFSCSMSRFSLVCFGRSNLRPFPTLPTGRQLNLDFQMVGATRIFIVVDRLQSILSDVARIRIGKRVSKRAKKIVSQ